MGPRVALTNNNKKNGRFDVCVCVRGGGQHTQRDTHPPRRTPHQQFFGLERRKWKNIEAPPVLVRVEVLSGPGDICLLFFSLFFLFSSSFVSQ